MTPYTFRSVVGGALAGMLAGLLVSAVVITFPTVALASHYDMGSSGLVDDAMATTLASAGINTTADLLHRTASVKDRKALVRKTGVTAAQIDTWRDFCDLLRIDGVGPKVARVMTLAGARNLKALVKFTPAEMATKIKDANKGTSILGKLPDAENLQTWIDQAKVILKADQKPAKKGGRK